MSITTGQTTTVYAYLETGTGTSTTRSETITATSTYGTLVVNAGPTVNIYVANESGGATDSWGDAATVNGLLEGTYTLKLSKTGYKDWTKQVSISAGLTTTVYAYLETGTGTSTTRNETITAASTSGSLSVSTTPALFGVSVYVGGEFGGTTNSSGDAIVNGLLPGTYTLRLTKSGYQDLVVQVTIVAGQTTTVEATLVP